MKLWTMLAGLAVAGILASSVVAQDDNKTPPPAKKGKGPAMAQWKDFTFTTAPKDKDDKVLTQDIYVATSTKNVPDERKERATTRAKAMYVRLAKAAGVTDADEKTTLSENQFDAGVKALRASFGKGKGKRGGGGGGGGGGTGDNKGPAT